MKTRVLIVAMVMGLWVMGVLVSPFAMAVELDFNISAPTSGTISYGGSGGALVGSNIEVDNVAGLSTPANANVTAALSELRIEFQHGPAEQCGRCKPE